MLLPKLSRSYRCLLTSAIQTNPAQPSRNMRNLLLITFLSVVTQISAQTCLDSNNVTICLGLKLESAQININTNQSKLCILHGSNSLIPNNSFVLMPELDGLFLNTTNVREIEVKAFAGLPRLKILGFFGNKISKIEQPVFVACGALKVLDLSGNDIEFLNEINWKGLEKLEELYLVHNLIRTIPDTGLESLQKLKNLDLSLNYLESLNSSSFQIFKKLIELNLAFNRIRTVENDAFNGLAKLEELNLRGNHLKKIEIENVVDNLPLLKRLHLRENKFVCQSLRQSKKTIYFCDENLY